MKGSIAISLLLVFGKVAGQRPHTGLWTAANIPVSFSNKLQMHNDAGYRTIGASANVHQYLYRTGIRYLFNNNISVTGGVAWFNTRTSYSKINHEYEHEFRFWQELNIQTPLTDKLVLQNRFRAEQRSFEATKNKQAYHANRYRYRTGVTYRITNKWSSELANEYMHQFQNSKGSFNQNRVLLSGMYQLNAATILQGGYMWLLWPDASQHIVTITFRKNISLHGNKNKS